MTTLKERFGKWKTTRSIWQKAGDIFFWLLLILLILPGPRKVISTTVNRVVLMVKTPKLYTEDQQVTVGQEEWHWVLRNSNGASIFLDVGKEKVIFLNFWATWCPPCVAELPEIQKLYEKYGDEVLFMLVTGEDSQRVEAFQEKYGYDLPVFYPVTAVPEIFESESIPTTFIISPEGKIVSKKKGAVNWDSQATQRIFEGMLR